MSPKFWLTIALLTLATNRVLAREFYVAPDGVDANPGSKDKPWATVAHARDVLRGSPRPATEPTTVILRGGVYYLNGPLVFTAEDSGLDKSPVQYRSAAGETAVLSGARPLSLHWESYKNGIQRTAVSLPGGAGDSFDVLFVDGREQHMARYPNYDPKAENFNGVAADALSPQRIKTWSHPETAFLHALHSARWGSVHYRVTGVDKRGNAILEGGWQTNREAGPHPQIRFVENVFEELDAPGEWFFDRTAGMLYLMPQPGVDLSKARIEVAGLKGLVEFRGSHEKPVSHITLAGIRFTQTSRTFMEKYEPLLRSDWSVYRGGAVLLEGTEDCTIDQSDFEDLGGNAVFVSGYNRRFSLTGSRITRTGGSGVCFVGDASAVRTPTYWDKPPDWATVDKTPGPSSPDYPADCRVQDCLLFHLGTVEKQVAAVQISISSRITVSHCSIYDLPRSGINIGEGTFGGHVIEFCDVFDTVKETGDHGSFNSWGRDRFWGIRGRPLAELVKEDPRLPTLDVVEPITLRNNRWRCDHGWDIDLDDGSTNYVILDNLCLHGGIKNREGFHRDVENNVIVDNTFHPHVWYQASDSRFQHNVVMAAYRPIGIKYWGDAVDYNLFAAPADLQQVQSRYHTDAHSIAGDPMFIDPAAGDYRVKDDSPALKVGFKNFPMDGFGVISLRLRDEARTPRLTNSDNAAAGASESAGPQQQWLGGTVRSISGAGEQSVYGLPDPLGVLVVKSPPGSELARLKLKTDDVIIAVGRQPVRDAASLIRLTRVAKDKPELVVIRGQKELRLPLSESPAP